MSDYRILKANAQPGVDGVAALEAMVRALVECEGWRPVGGPFFDSAMMTWCQAVEKLAVQPPGEIPLREPAQHVETMTPRVHSDPRDKPLQMRVKAEPS